jgi:ribonuclease-3
VALAVGRALEPVNDDRAMKRKAAGLEALEERLGHVFNDKSLLTRALTHSSAIAGKSRVESYQRLEFLGDRVLGLAIAEMLMRSFPKATEGELSRRLAGLVRADSCAAVARAMQLETVIALGSASRNASRLTAAILADACEAVVGAVFVDAGYAPAFAVVEKFWAERMLARQQMLRDPKTTLQEWAQGQGLPTPSYNEIERTGPHHNPKFRVLVELPGHTPTEGMGRSKRAAEQAAAAAMLQQEGVPMSDENA